ncbi:hypothetical protein EDM00_11815 [Ornithobacterium rhinotracheale]|nr:hypothetical protein [Ornithobacterium rhinotracheale]MRJ11178.1 hypothetical protein [Ornithobacterium rhinotracheale]
MCYIIPGRYYCIFKPDDNYIQTNNKQYLTLYFSNNLPNKIIVRNQGNASGGKGEYKIINNRKEKLQFFAYSDIYKAILYKPNAVKFIDVKPNTEYIDLVIDENYAIDKTGGKLE